MVTDLFLQMYNNQNTMIYMQSFHILLKKWASLLLIHITKKIERPNVNFNKILKRKEDKYWIKGDNSYCLAVYTTAVGILEDKNRFIL